MWKTIKHAAKNRSDCTLKYLISKWAFFVTQSPLLLLDLPFLLCCLLVHHHACIFLVMELQYAINELVAGADATMAHTLLHCCTPTMNQSYLPKCLDYLSLWESLHVKLMKILKHTYNDSCQTNEHETPRTLLLLLKPPQFRGMLT